MTLGPWRLFPLDIGRFVRGASFSLRQLTQNEGDGFWSLKAPAADPGFRIPVFFIRGGRDQVTPPALVANYEAALRAPLKQHYLLPEAGHFAFFTHPRQFAEAMKDIRQRTIRRAAPASR